MAAIQLSFTLRTSSNVKTVHLLGSWDNYAGQLPLSKDGSKKGAWKGTFRFQTSMLKLGQRYWFYYMLDGYHVSHDPAQPFTTEKTTGRQLNVLDVPSDDGGSKHSSKSHHSSGQSRLSLDIPKGRSLSPSKIQCPKPSKPYASRTIREADYAHSPVSPSSSTRGSEIDALTSRFERYQLSASPPSSIDSSSMSGRSSGSSPTSFSSLSDDSNRYECRCERYGVTRSGERVKLDCGGARCGYLSSEASSGCSSSSDSEGEYYHVEPRSPRRQTMRTRR